MITRQFWICDKNQGSKVTLEGGTHFPQQRGKNAKGASFLRHFFKPSCAHGRFPSLWKWVSLLTERITEQVVADLFQLCIQNASKPIMIHHKRFQGMDRVVNWGQLLRSNVQLYVQDSLFSVYFFLSNFARRDNRQKRFSNEPSFSLGWRTFREDIIVGEKPMTEQDKEMLCANTFNFRSTAFLVAVVWSRNTIH